MANDTRVEDLLRQLAPEVLDGVVRRYGSFDLAEDAVCRRRSWPRGCSGRGGRPGGAGSGLPAQDGELMVVLVRRTQGGAHGGQLALPGGQRDPGDADLAATALREANEELGLTADHVELLAARPVVATQTTGFRIAPFPARLVGPVPWRIQKREVTAVVEVRVADPARGAPRGGPGLPDLAGGSGCGGWAATTSGG